MIYFVDIDKTICDTPEGKTYEDAVPNMENIAKINSIIMEGVGHKVVYWTARGSLVGQPTDWYRTTIEQLNEWGCLYTEVRMGKPYYDVLIDDKAFKIEDLE